MKLLLFVAILLNLAVNTSCLKKQNLNDDELGAAFEPALLTTAMKEGFGNLDYGAIKENEFTRYVKTEKVQDVTVIPIEQQDILVQGASDTPTDLILDLLVTTTDFPGGGQSSQSAPRVWHQDFQKGSSTTSDTQQSSSVRPPVLMFIQFQALAYDYCSPNNDYPGTCHKLVISDFDYPVPPTALAQHNCSDPQNCFIKARRIEFDYLSNTEIDSDGKPRRVHYTTILSKEVPYLSRVLQFCSRSLYETPAYPQKVLADICYDITDYAFGGTK